MPLPLSAGIKVQSGVPLEIGVPKLYVAGPGFGCVFVCLFTKLYIS